MNHISFWDVVKFALRHPSLLLWAIDFRHDKRIDELIEFLFRQSGFVKVLYRDETTLCLSVEGCSYRFWRLQRFHDYLTYCDGAHAVTTLCGKMEPIWDHARPSLKHAYLFDRYFVGPRKTKPREVPHTFILSRQEVEVVR